MTRFTISDAETLTRTSSASFVARYYDRDRRMDAEEIYLIT